MDGGSRPRQRLEVSRGERCEGGEGGELGRVWDFIHAYMVWGGNYLQL